MFETFISGLGISAAAVSLAAVVYSFLHAKVKYYKVQESYRDIAAYYHEHMVGHHKKFKFDGEDIYSLRELLAPLVEQSTKAISNISGKDIRAAVKLLEQAEGKSDLNVVTFWRDSKSQKNRETLEVKYPVEQNTAFKNLLESDGYKNYFLSNKLNSASEGGYFNVNKNWKGFYKSTLVVPLTHERNGERVVLGFLAYDSSEENAFDGDAIEYVRKVSDLASTILADSILENTEKDFVPLNKL